MTHVTHTKSGGEYRIEALALDVESKDVSVVYRSLADGKVFTRNLDDFFGIDHSAEPDDHGRRPFRFEGAIEAINALLAAANRDDDDDRERCTDDLAA